MDELGVGRVRMTATSAARDAANREEFFAAAAAVIGVRPELLAGDEEGRLSFLGATAELRPGSAARGWSPTSAAARPSWPSARPPAAAPAAVRSLDVGCVRITERFLLSDPPTEGQLAAARRSSPTPGRCQPARTPRSVERPALVGLAGTVAALAAIAQELDSYDRSRVHHYLLTRTVVGELLSVLAAGAGRGPAAPAREWRRTGPT